MDGGAGLAVYIAREEPSIFKRLIWWSEQKIRQVSLLIRVWKVSVPAALVHITLSSSP